MKPYLTLLILVVSVLPLSADTPPRLAPRPIPGMTAPSPVPIPTPAKQEQPAARPAAEVVKSGAARILYIHRRGTFTLPSELKRQKVTVREQSKATSSERTPTTSLAEGKVRIVPRSPLRN